MISDLGWPGGRESGNTEMQMKQNWQKVDSCWNWGRVCGGSVDYIQHLLEIAHNEMFKVFLKNLTGGRWSGNWGGQQRCRQPCGWRGSSCWGSKQVSWASLGSDLVGVWTWFLPLRGRRERSESVSQRLPWVRLSWQLKTPSVLPEMLSLRFFLPPCNVVFSTHTSRTPPYQIPSPRKFRAPNINIFKKHDGASSFACLCLGPSPYWPVYTCISGWGG